MNDQQKAFLVLTLASALILFATRAHAAVRDLPAQECCAAVSHERCGLAPAALRGSASDVDTAAHTLEQAALQWDLASNLQEIEWLQKAHDLLVESLAGLECDQRQAAVQIASEIDHLIVRDSARFGPLVAPDAGQFGPPPPKRSELAGLAGRGIELERSVDSLAVLGATTETRVPPGAWPVTHAASPGATPFSAKS